MGKHKGERVQVEASHQALSVVAGWLGLSTQEALEADASHLEQPPARTPFLGLGAKFLPHHKGVSHAATLDNRLKQRIEAGRKRKARQANDEGEAFGAASGVVQAGLLSHGGLAQQVNRHAARPSSGTEDDEDVGKSSSFKQRNRVNLSGHAQTPVTVQPATPSAPGLAGGVKGQAGPLPGSRAAREALLLGAGQTSSVTHQAQAGNKKKKKKKNRSDSGIAGMT